jgi:6,7-dimethyl-8-ribityllumazine synthase
MNPQQGSADASQLRIGVVVARFNSEVTSRLEAGAVQALQEMGLRADHLQVVRVPGAVEIPLAVKVLLEAGLDGVVALGAVIRGETSHYDYVCAAVERGCTQLQLEYLKPVGFGVLTVEDDAQAMARAGGAHGNKGYEAAQVTVEMVNLIRAIR